MKTVPMSGVEGAHITNFMVEGPQAGALVAAEGKRLKCVIVIGPPKEMPLHTVDQLVAKGLGGMYRGKEA